MKTMEYKTVELRVTGIVDENSKIVGFIHRNGRTDVFVCEEAKPEHVAEFIGKVPLNPQV